MQHLIYSLFIVIFKASMYCQKTIFFLFYLILINKLFILRKYFAHNFCTGETWCCFQTKINISVSAKIIFINRKILDIGKNPIWCIPNKYQIKKTIKTTENQKCCLGN